MWKASNHVPPFDIVLDEVGQVVCASSVNRIERRIFISIQVISDSKRTRTPRMVWHAAFLHSVFFPPFSVRSRIKYTPKANEQQKKKTERKYEKIKTVSVVSW